MGEMLLNGRRPLDWELPAMERGRDCELKRDMAVLAGLLTGVPLVVPERAPRPVTDIDIAWEFR